MAKLNPMTNYNCRESSGGCGKYGVYTGAYLNPKDTDDRCKSCGALLVEDKPDGNRYRVEFETISPHIAAEMEHYNGKGVWQRLTDAEWNALTWYPVSREDYSKHSIETQYQNLLASATSHSQPIRNVRMLVATQGEFEEQPMSTAKLLLLAAQQRERWCADPISAALAELREIGEHPEIVFKTAKVFVRFTYHPTARAACNTEFTGGDLNEALAKARAWKSEQGESNGGVERGAQGA